MNDLTGTATYDIFGAAPAPVGAIFFLSLFPSVPFFFFTAFHLLCFHLTFLSQIVFFLTKLSCFLKLLHSASISIPGYVVF